MNAPVLIRFPHSPERIVIQGRINGIESKLHQLKEEIGLVSYRIRMQMDRSLIRTGLDDQQHLRNVSAHIDNLMEEVFGARWHELVRELDEEGGDAFAWQFPRQEG